MLEGPFRKDRKFIRFCNESVVHLIRFEGGDKKTVEVKRKDGKTELRSAHLPQLTIEQIEEIGRDVVNDLRGDDAPMSYGLPRLEIWRFDKTSLHQQGKRGRGIPTAEIVAAIKAAQKKLGKPMSRKSFLLVDAALKAAERALDSEKPADRTAAVRALEKAGRLKDLTPAAKEALADLTRELG